MNYSYSLVENAFEIEKLILEQDEQYSRYWNFKALVINQTHDIGLSLKSSQSFKRTKQWVENNIELFI